jgi:uncharacterized tellurite resistance protein B-like protein
MARLKTGLTMSRIALRCTTQRNDAGIKSSRDFDREATSLELQAAWLRAQLDNKNSSFSLTAHG